MISGAIKEFEKAEMLLWPLFQIVSSIISSTHIYIYIYGGSIINQDQILLATNSFFFHHHWVIHFDKFQLFIDTIPFKHSNEIYVYIY